MMIVTVCIGGGIRGTETPREVDGHRGADLELVVVEVLVVVVVVVIMSGGVGHIHVSRCRRG